MPGDKRLTSYIEQTEAADAPPEFAELTRWLATPVASLKGVGPAREKTLARNRLHTFRDLLLLLPRRFTERLRPRGVADLVPSEVCAARGTILSRRVSGFGRRKNLRVLVADRAPQKGRKDERAPTAELVLFGRAFLKNSFRSGRRVAFQGKVSDETGKVQVLSPDFHLDGDAGPGFPGLRPHYSLPEGIFPRHFASWIAQIIDGLPPEADWNRIPDRVGLPDRGLIPLARALRDAHQPRTPAEVEQARRRLAYEEFFAMQCDLARDRLGRAGQPTSLSALPGRLEKVYREILPFSLTGAQERTIQEIGRDLARPGPMHRLLQGDVGSGKTVVALYPLLAAALGGGQGALMAPTEVLAEQHARVLDQILAPAGIRPRLLRAGLKTAEVERIVGDPGTGIVIGTHALIQKRVRFRRLDACVIDEQHKFGVRQRWDLKVKGTAPHVLIMTATPIPRTLSLTLYGELDISILDEQPPGRKPITTVAAAAIDDPSLRAWIDGEIDSGGRVFAVCPLVAESDHLDLEAATALHGRFEKEYGARCGVALLHGRMDSAAKRDAVDAFRSGRQPLLVTTVVVEVGVDVPEASTVVIMDAWRFGLSQLHQIRGRVGRGRRPSRCYLVGKANTDSGKERVAIILNESNGFRIAEEDLRMRGPGEATGLRQHGLPPLRAGDYIADVDLMAAARDDARLAVEEGIDGGLSLFDGASDLHTWIG